MMADFFFGGVIFDLLKSEYKNQNRLKKWQLKLLFSQKDNKIFRIRSFRMWWAGFKLRLGSVGGSDDL